MNAYTQIMFFAAAVWIKNKKKTRLTRLELFTTKSTEFFFPPCIVSGSNLSSYVLRTMYDVYISF